MLTLDELRKYGADVDSGMARCMNNEAFYLKLVARSVGDATFEKLRTSIDENKLDEAFEAAHSLKGVLGNLSLTPIYDPVVEITELLRSRTEMDYMELSEKIFSKRDELAAICE